MKLVNTWYEKRWVKLLLAVTANLVFLHVLLKAYIPMYETNDDIFISMFIDGQMSNKSNYILFCNYFLAAVMRLIYDLAGNSFPVYSYLQYGALFLSFTVISYIFLKRCNIFAAIAAAACLLGAFAADCYIWLTFTKTASMSAIAGVLLMLSALEKNSGKIERIAGLTVGIVLSLYSAMLRMESFGLMLLMLFPLGAYELISRAKLSENKFKTGFRYFRPFLLMLVMAFMLYCGNELMWMRSPYMEYKEFISSAAEIVDYHIELSTYDTMPEVYESLGITRDVCDMANGYSSYDDTEIWTANVCKQITDARDKLGLYPGFRELIRTFLECCAYFVHYKFFWGFAGLALLWLLMARHNRYTLAVVFGQLAIFSAIYFVFVWLDRYSYNRVDIGMFMAISVSLIWQLKDSKPGNWRAGLCLLIAVLAIPTFASKCTSRRFNWEKVELINYSKQQIQRIMDDEHLFLVGNDTLDLHIYSPLEVFPQGYRDKLYFSGGWVVRHPQVMELLAEYDVENPYKDSVNNEKVYFIPNDVERLVRYVRYYYDENARAELVEDLSAEVGINIYKLVS